MKALLVILLLCYASSLSVVRASEKSMGKERRFPDSFLFGTATASYQIEGAWNEDGKTESIWDVASHEEPCIIKDCHTGDIAADSYHNYKRDVQMLRELGVDFYRFSISWNRILPNGFANNVNEVGIAYYNNLIDEMLKYNITPFVTLYHWDLPQNLQDLGGWLNPLIANWFGDYSRVVYERFGDRVKKIITINEPREICYDGYGSGNKAPNLKEDGIANYICNKNLLIAHARAWHIYDEEFRASQDGIVGITLSKTWYISASDLEDDKEATEDQFIFEWNYSHPIFSETGDWHPRLKEKIAARSAAQGYPRSRLPEFSAKEIEYVKGTSDFMGINMYSANYVYRNASIDNFLEEPSFYHDAYTGTFQDPEWPTSASSWLKEVPWGLYKLLLKLKDDYKNVPVYITENGVSTWGGIVDEERVRYYRNYLNAVLDALDEGCNVLGYTAWSLMDNFEWKEAYTERFGLYEVDFEDPARTRTPRKSAFVYKEIIRSRTIDYEYEPASMTMTIDEAL